LLQDGAGAGAAAGTAAGSAGLIRPEALDESRIEDLIGQHLLHNLEILPEEVGERFAEDGWLFEVWGVQCALKQH
jgi:hypothetical protein